MDIQKIQERFKDLMLANPDFDESLLEKDEEGCYVDSDIADMYSMFEAGTEVGEAWQAAKASVPEGFVLMPKEPSPKIVEAFWNNWLVENPNAQTMYFAYKAMIDEVSK